MLPFDKVTAFSYPTSRSDFFLLTKRRPYVFAGGLIAFLLIFFRLISSATKDSPDFYTSKPPSSFATAWEYPRDAKKLTLSRHECDAAFPRLSTEVRRAIRDRNGNKITLEELESIPKRNGYIRGMIYDQELYVLDTQGQIYSRGIATLLDLHRAIITAPEPLPNIEFTFSTDDWLPPAAQWAYARKADDRQTWLMPDFGFYSWPETKVGSYGEVQEKAIAMEDTALNPSGQAWSWDVKYPKLVWRGATMGLPLRDAFVELTHNKTWADVTALDWHNKNSTDSDLKSMDEHCQYKFVAHTEGNSYSGRLKYLQNCRSVVVAHELDWIQHFSPLMSSSGPTQNFLQIKRDFSDMDEAMEKQLQDDDRAKQIADNSVKTFRERYTTPSAEACYWRDLIRGWSEVSFKPNAWEKDLETGLMKRRGIPVESYVLERRLRWDPY